MENVSAEKIRYKLKNLYRRHFVRPFAEKKIYDLRNNHYIFADPRGGSTWLMEIIQHITGEPVIWEPLDLKLKNNPFHALNFDWRQFIPSDEKWPEAKKVFSLLFEGRILEKNILDHSSISQLNNSSTLLFKICRGNALLPWLTENFEFKYQPIYLVRHPFAVASSQLRHGAWDHLDKKFEIPLTPFNSHYLKHKAFLETIHSNEEILVAKWCLSNLKTLNHINNNKKWICITYENLVMDPDLQIERILQSWRINYDISNLNFEKNSYTTHKDSPNLNADKISSWQKKLSQSQIDKMGRVLDYFDAQIYTKDSAFPNHNFSENL